MAVARSSAVALLSVLGNILDFFKIEAGTLELESAFELATVLDDALEIVAHVASSRRRCAAGSRERTEGSADRRRVVVVL